MDAGQCIAKSALEFPYYFYGNGICGGRDREAAEGSMKHQFPSVYLNVSVNKLDSDGFCMFEWAGQAKENLPGGSLKYQFVYSKIRILFKYSYRRYF